MKTEFFLYETEQLNTLASAETVKQGLAYYSENRVFALDVQGKQLSSQVEGSLKDQPYCVELSINSENKLQSHCDCSSDEKICKHAIASLYSYAESVSHAEQDVFGGAVDEAIKERVKKGRNEVSVKLLSGNLAFGVWQALLNNFAIERAAFGGVEIGILQSLREIPGFMAFSVVLS